LRLKEPVQVGQTLTLKNVGTKEEIACMEVDINSRDRETPEIGVEFANTCPRFWRASFPPANWNPRCPEAKQVVQPKAVPFSSKCSSALGKEIVKTEKDIHRMDGSGVGFLLSLVRLGSYTTMDCGSWMCA
jgi:hypothetical protein